MSDKTADTIEPAVLLELTTKIVTSYAAKAKLSASELIDTIGSVSKALAGVGVAPAEPAAVELVPAVPVKKSVAPDYVVCLEDGKKLKMLKRHLMSTYGMTPEQYREKWSLPKDYPMVAPNYAKTRSDLAKKIGLGRPAGAPAPVAAPEPAPAPAPAKRGRKKAVAAPAEA
jgi:predicted transcriptional regulator